MFCSFLAMLALSFVGTAVAMEEYLFWNKVKLVYCYRIRNQPIFRNEELAENCVIKVDFFEKNVSLICFNPLNSSNLTHGAQLKGQYLALWKSELLIVLSMPASRPNFWSFCWWQKTSNQFKSKISLVRKSQTRLISIKRDAWGHSVKIQFS